jgi:hypothetical protein
MNKDEQARIETRNRRLKRGRFTSGLPVVSVYFYVDHHSPCSSVGI